MGEGREAAAPCLSLLCVPGPRWTPACVVAAGPRAPVPHPESLASGPVSFLPCDIPENTASPSIPSSRHGVHTVKSANRVLVNITV